MPVLVRPRDLYYENGKYWFRLENDSKADAEERERSGLSVLDDETAKIF